MINTPNQLFLITKDDIPKVPIEFSEEARK